MSAKDIIKYSFTMSNMVVDSYLADLTNEEWMKRPHAECNHVNWQVGHIISSNNFILTAAVPDSLPALPDGMSDQYAKEKATSDDASQFMSKDELLAVLAKQREAIMSCLESIPDEDLDKPTPESIQRLAPNVGGAFEMLCLHWMMHAGQWVVVRRELGKPVVI